MTASVGVIGLGRMAQALVRPLVERGIFAASDCIGVVAREDSAQRLRTELPAGFTVVSASDPQAAQAWMAPVQLLAVKPQQLDAVAAGVLPPADSTSSLVISVLAGITLERLQHTFPGRVLSLIHI